MADTVTKAECQKMIDDAVKPLQVLVTQLQGCIAPCEGSPENVIAAPVGSLRRRTDGGANTTLYVKETGGTGNTGWTAK